MRPKEGLGRGRKGSPGSCKCTSQGTGWGWGQSKVGQVRLEEVTRYISLGLQATGNTGDFGASSSRGMMSTLEIGKEWLRPRVTS